MSNEPTIEQMNEAIALFHGWELIKGDPDHKCSFCFAGDDPCGPAVDRFIKNGHKGYWTYNDLEYHSSWDVLIPAILKAKALYLNYDSGEMRDQLKMRYKAIENELCNLSLINTHYCLFKFIQWYQKQQSNANDTTEGND